MEELKKSRKEFNANDHGECSDGTECGTCTSCGVDLILGETSWRDCGGWLFCSNCQNNEQKLFSCITLIDRTSLTVEQKPLAWNCFKCKSKLGGGCKWYLLFNDMDICEKCMLNEDKSFNNNFLDDVRLITTTDTYVKIDRLYEILLNVNSVADHEFTVPNEVIELVTKSRNDTLIDCISELIECDISDSFLKWTLITDFEVIDFYPAHTCLAIKCEHPYPIASLCSDDHGRTSFDVVCDSYEDYCNEKDLWEPLNKPELDDLTKKNNEKLHAGGEVNDEDCMNASKSFSEYIRFKRNLGFYFG